MARKHRRSLEAPQYSAGQRRPRTMEQGNVVARYLLRTVYDYDMTGGSGAGGVRADAAFRLVNELSVNLPGGEGPRAVVNVYGHTLYKILKLLEPALLTQLHPSAVAASTDEDGRRSVIPIPFHVLRSLSPYEFALPTMHAGRPELVVTWGNPADLFTDAIDGVPSFSNVVPTVIEERLEGAGAEPTEIARRGLHFIRKYRKEITQAGDTVVDLEQLAGYEIVRIFVQARDTGAGGGYEDSDSLVNTVELEVNGTEIIEALPWDLLQAVNAEQYQLSSAESGVVCLDAAEDMRTERGQLWPVNPPRDPRVKLNVDAPTGSGEVIVTVEGVSRRANANGR